MNSDMFHPCCWRKVRSRGQDPGSKGCGQQGVRCSLATRRHFHPALGEQSVSPEACRDHMQKGIGSLVRNKLATTERKSIHYIYQNAHARSLIKYSDSRNLKFLKQCKHIITHNQSIETAILLYIILRANYMIT